MIHFKYPFLAALCAALLLGGCATGPAPHSQAARTAAVRDHFYVGGRYVGEAGRELMAGQMYVEKLTPSKVTRPLPLVFVHGAAQTAANWLMTPDGRKGWAEHFMDLGYVVYLVDQPARGRSAWHSDVNGRWRMFTAPQLERLFTASAQLGDWPQAKLHTQWPGSGRRGDPVFDAFYASQVQSLASDSETQELAKAAGAALLDRIGPAVIVTHSQAGLLGWVIADARPALVKAIMAIEPSGPPFHNVAPGNPKARAWGITDIPVRYDPAVSDPTELQTQKQSAPDAEGLVACTLQREPARKLVQFAKIPVLITTAEASSHAPYDHCTAAYMRQAGVPVEFIRLEQRGIRGNGHMVIMEKNNLQVVDFVERWIRQRVEP
jgi:pimeloyl-ACP methyl ester carboxylesterase